MPSGSVDVDPSKVAVSPADVAVNAAVGARFAAVTVTVEDSWAVPPRLSVTVTVTG